MIIQPQVITQGDYGYELPFTLQDGNGDEMDLTSASLVLNVQDAQEQPDPTGLPRVTRWTRFWRWFDDTALRILRRR